VLELWAVAVENDARPADTAAAVEQLVARDPEALILAVDADVIVGSVIAGWDGWRYHLYRLSVHPSVRRRGIGSGSLPRAEAESQGEWRRWVKQPE
jgi:ribosomal protein S18 acetylase RimI-like enzyme